MPSAYLLTPVPAAQPRVIEPVQVRCADGGAYILPLLEHSYATGGGLNFVYPNNAVRIYNRVFVSPGEGLQRFPGPMVRLNIFNVRPARRHACPH